MDSPFLVCFRLDKAVNFLVFVEKKTSDMYLHIHTAAACAWMHVGRVEKKAVATPKQEPKNVANPKSKRSQLQTCGRIKTPTPT